MKQPEGVLTNRDITLVVILVLLLLVIALYLAGPFIGGSYDAL